MKHFYNLILNLKVICKKNIIYKEHTNKNSIYNSRISSIEDMLKLHPISIVYQRSTGLINRISSWVKSLTSHINILNSIRARFIKYRLIKQMPIWGSNLEVNQLEKFNSKSGSNLEVNQLN